MGSKGPADKALIMRIDLPVMLEELVSIRRRVRALSIDALKIVLSITGAMPECSFREGFEILTTNDLFQVRLLCSRMGLGATNGTNLLTNFL